MKRSFNILILLVLFAFVSTNAIAQPHRAKERLDMIKKMKMLEILELDEAKGEKFLLKYNVYEQKIENLHKEMSDVSVKLRKAIRNKSEDQYKDLSNKVIDQQQQLFDVQIEKFKVMKEILTEEEYAKYILFENHFPNMIRRYLADPDRRDRPDKRKW